MKKILFFITLLFVALAGVGCTAITAVPPGGCLYFEHVGNYGPFLQTHVIAHNTVKNEDGSLTVGDYTGMVQVLGYGPHDVIQGLHVDAKPPAVAKSP